MTRSSSPTFSSSAWGLTAALPRASNSAPFRLGLPYHNLAAADVQYDEQACGPRLPVPGLDHATTRSSQAGLSRDNAWIQPEPAPETVPTGATGPDPTDGPGLPGVPVQTQTRLSATRERRDLLTGRAALCHMMTRAVVTAVTVRSRLFQHGLLASLLFVSTRR